MKKTKRVGGRKNSGRKKIADKKRHLNLYIRGSKIDKAGGEEALISKILTENDLLD